MSFGVFPDLNKILDSLNHHLPRIRPATSRQTPRAFCQAAKRAAKNNYRIYEVMAECPAPTIIITLGREICRFRISPFGFKEMERLHARERLCQNCNRRFD
jgi:hypothetical protein